jgi:uncharacterized protein YecE (DUF72 family)
VQHDRSKEIEAWLKVMPTLAGRVKTVYGYVNNHFSGHAPATVRDLQRQLGQVVVDPAQLGDQLQLF